MAAAPPKKVEEPRPLASAVTEDLLKSCPRLPSLRSVGNALRELVNSDESSTADISELIRRDPSLTASLLRRVNSAYYGLPTQIDSIEEAVLYLGIRQIRQLAMVTPVIEDLKMLVGNSAFPWREFWRHCIGVATLAREALVTINRDDPADEAAYVAGLVHDVGRIAMASVFPAHFSEICRRVALPGAGPIELIEAEWLGLNHAQIGALYLESHQLPEATIEAALLHHAPEQAIHQPKIVAAVQIADLMVRFANIGTSGDPAPVLETACSQATGWKILYPTAPDSERADAYAGLGRTLKRLPLMLQGVI